MSTLVRPTTLGPVLVFVCCCVWLAGCGESESAVDSVSCWPVWTGKSKASPREVVPARTSNSIFSIRQGKWKYIEHDPDNPTKRKDENSDQLYDLEKDPGEEHNIIAQNPEVAERLKRELAKVK